MTEMMESGHDVREVGWGSFLGLDSYWFLVVVVGLNPIPKWFLLVVVLKQTNYYFTSLNKGKTHVVFH